MNTAARASRYRARRSRGEIVLAIVVDEVSVVERMIDAGLLLKSESENRKKLSEAVSRFILEGSEA